VRDKNTNQPNKQGQNKQTQNKQNTKQTKHKTNKTQNKHFFIDSNIVLPSLNIKLLIHTVVVLVL
jgi:hypothetical protein